MELQFQTLKFDLAETVSEREAGAFEADFYRAAIRAVEHGVRTGAIVINSEAKLVLEDLEAELLIQKLVDKVQAQRQFNQVTPQMLDSITTFVIDEWWRTLVQLHHHMSSNWFGVNVSSWLVATKKGSWQRYLDALTHGGIKQR